MGKFLAYLKKTNKYWGYFRFSENNPYALNPKNLALEFLAEDFLKWLIVTKDIMRSFKTN